MPMERRVFLQDIAYKRDLGAVLAKGIKTAAAELGLADLTIHVKGMEPAACDPRYLKGMALGLCHSPGSLSPAGHLLSSGAGGS